MKRRLRTIANRDDALARRRVLRAFDRQWPTLADRAEARFEYPGKAAQAMGISGRWRVYVGDDGPVFDVVDRRVGVGFVRVGPI